MEHQADLMANRCAKTAAMGRPVSCLRYVSESRAALLRRLGIKSIWDLVSFLPMRYLDMSEVSTIVESRVSDSATILATVDTVLLKKPRPRMTVVEVHVYDRTAGMCVTFFGQPWLAQKFKKGQLLVLNGKMGISRGLKSMNSPYFEVLSEDPDEGGLPERVKVMPVHHATEGLSPQWVRRLVSGALGEFGDLLDPWPASIRARAGVMSLSNALRALQFPDSTEQAEQARRRLAFDEVAFLGIALASRRDSKIPGVTPTAHVVGDRALKAIEGALPFGLTSDQSKAVSEILSDMAAPKPMNRLLLGDVGTGKTAVATLILGAVADTKTQAAVMAPTGVLAQQYADKVGPILDKAGVSWALLTGATPQASRRPLLEGLESGRICVLFGTHALLTDSVKFNRLSLVVVDEQQRFGVNQRNTLREKGRGADLLVMTATPIPRTLALALYGDLDRSYLRERPVVGAGVSTTVISKRNRADAYEAIREALAQGRQAYVICPLVGLPTPADDVDMDALDVEAGEDRSDPKAAEHEVEVLSEQVFRGFSVGLLTGRMKPLEKAATMARFKSGEIQVLVSTTVVEVGVDVPNATVMLIEDAERFGLSQLHQLRGRVGRGKHPGFVYLCADTKSDAGKERLRALERTSDGFELAEEDLRLRREGDIMGIRQSGDVALKFVDPVRDAALVESAHEIVGQILSDDRNLESTSHLGVRAEVLARYGDVFREVSGG